jgi:hypothetical protein
MRSWYSPEKNKTEKNFKKKSIEKWGNQNAALLKAIFWGFFFARVALACLHAHAPEEVLITPRLGAHELMSEGGKKKRPVVWRAHTLQ